MSMYPYNEPQPQPAAEPGPPTPMWMVAIGWIITLLVVAGFGFSVFGKLTHYKPEKPMPDVGWPGTHMQALAFVELICIFLYLFPRTVTLGAILLTGYAGGAVATHARISDFENMVPAIVLGVLVWLGLLLRDARVRALLPIRSMSPDAGGVGFSSFGATIGFALLAILFTLAGIIAVVCGVAALQPAEYTISRSITIDAPPEQVFPMVNDFRNWEKWNPFLKMDPSSAITISTPSAGKDATYQWKGNDQVGEGKMIILDSVPSKSVKIKLDFLKPIEDTADVEFTFVPDGDKTVVTWKMAGRREFLMKAMVVAMDMNSLISGKFDEGLADMKQAVEKKKSSE
ncbi:MAG TPA: SRPBCC family protein [Gemmataceae bacterium]|nr:SRPBCC family protein [Gemmataceae bacterium]